MYKYIKFSHFYRGLVIYYLVHSPVPQWLIAQRINSEFQILNKTRNSRTHRKRQKNKKKLEMEKVRSTKIVKKKKFV